MLVLSRKRGQRIVIDDKIVVTVLHYGKGSGGGVKIGIEAPPEIKVRREEVLPRDQPEKNL